MQLLYWFEGLRTPFWDSFFGALTHLGSETLFMVIAIVVMWCVGKHEGYYLLTTGLLGTTLNQWMKLACKIPRPWVRDPRFTIVEAARADAGGYSFPSGHTQNVTASLGCTARSVKNRAVRAVCIVLIVLTAVSRMYLGVHTPADVGFALAAGVAMVFALYPLFEKSKEKPALLLGTLGVVTLVALANVAYVELAKWPADIDLENLMEGRKNAYVLLGCTSGMLLGAWIESRRIRFDTRAPLGMQVLKTALGLALVMAIRVAVKPVANAICGGHPVANTIRYACMVLFAVCVWPLTFPWFARKCPLGRRGKRVLKVLGIVLLIIALLGFAAFRYVTCDTSDAPISTDNAANPLITPLGKTMLSGHRAGGGIAPENTMMALKNCVESTEYELDIFEFDIHLTKDHVAVLLHDDTLDRTSDAEEVFGRSGVTVGEMSFEELKQLNMGEKFVNHLGETPFAGLRGEAVPDELRITGLDEALAYLESVKPYHYIIEIKNSGEEGRIAAVILYEALAKYGCLERAVVGTFHNEITDYMQQAHPDMFRSAGVNEVITFFIRAQLGMKAPKGGFPYVALQIPTTDYIINLGTSRIVNYAHQNGLAVQYWTINSAEEMARLQSIGADAIMTDEPDLAAGVLAQP